MDEGKRFCGYVLTHKRQEAIMGGKTIAILGGGVGGLVAANELRRLLDAEHRIVLIEKSRQHAFAPSSRP